ncbi:hypothetical protein, partial [Mesorhizobium sp. M1C.F.Ca.ET.176.01.1.1]|uniref:hypothetical protein n=1 Tax=Mesorhizobium sp. M1C.F.Ca.ET.176.01.1.1 TaxID=2563922 RepID=UPI001AEEE8C1
ANNVRDLTGFRGPATDFPVARHLYACRGAVPIRTVAFHAETKTLSAFLHAVKSSQTQAPQRPQRPEEYATRVEVDDVAHHRRTKPMATGRKLSVLERRQ